VINLLRPSGWLVTVTGPGFVGVTFFFVLSGLVLSWSAKPGTTARRFYRNRFARVWPTHALTWLAAGLLLGFTSAAGVTLALLQSWVPRTDVYFGMNGVSWSLGCEAVFYALFPMLLIGVRRVRSLTALALAIVFLMSTVGAIVYTQASPSFAVWFLYVCPAYRLGEFTLGVVLGVALSRGLRVKVPLPLATFLLFTSLALVAAKGHSMRLIGYNTPDVWLYNMAALPGIMLLLAAAATSDLEGRRSLLSSRLVVVGGEWSFALYMTHQLVMKIAGEHLSSGAAIIASMALVLPVAAAVHVAWERPVERWIRNTRRGEPATLNLPRSLSVDASTGQ
jgi:peptidoglycan/LPS O-acetylase OafA/YrhL